MLQSAGRSLLVQNGGDLGSGRNPSQGTGAEVRRAICKVTELPTLFPRERRPLHPRLPRRWHNPHHNNGKRRRLDIFGARSGGLMKRRVPVSASDVHSCTNPPRSLCDGLCLRISTAVAYPDYGVRIKRLIAMGAGRRAIQLWMTLPASPKATLCRRSYHLYPPRHAWQFWVGWRFATEVIRFRELGEHKGGINIGCKAGTLERHGDSGRHDQPTHVTAHLRVSRIMPTRILGCSRCNSNHGRSGVKRREGSGDFTKGAESRRRV